MSQYICADACFVKNGIVIPWLLPSASAAIRMRKPHNEDVNNTLRSLLSIVT
jgi:hypothetical protein